MTDLKTTIERAITNQGADPSVLAQLAADAIEKAMDKFNAELGEQSCKKCGGDMKRGQATGQTFVGGMPDFPDDKHSSTFSAGGAGKLIDCMKCSECGWSVTGPDFTPQVYEGHGHTTVIELTPDFLPLPVNREHAEKMVLVGQRWLDDNTELGTQEQDFYDWLGVYACDRPYLNKASPIIKAAFTAGQAQAVAGKVVVKGLVWVESWGGEYEDIPSWEASTSIGNYRISTAGFGISTHNDAKPKWLADEKAKSQEFHQQRVLSALILAEIEGGGV